MPQTKSQKKFERNHLKDVLKRRKEVAKVKQKKQMAEKKKARRAADNAKEGDDDTQAQRKKAKDVKDAERFGEMTVDDFFAGGFDIPEDPKQKKSKKNKDVPSKTGKRKRTEEEGNDSDASSAISVEADPIANGHSDEGSDDDMGDHKAQLEALAKKDPEFYKYLQENDAELLDFAEDAGLAEIDELSGTDEDEQPSKKKQKKKGKKADSDDENEDDDGKAVTKAMIKKWEAAMKDQHSLRAMREVVLAFRAAAHLNDEDPKEYKYSINSPEAYHQLLVVALRHVPDVLNHHLPAKETADGKVRLATESKKFRTLSPTLKSHTMSILHLLPNISTPNDLQFTLSFVKPLLPYILSFKKLIRDLVKVVVEMWSSSSNSDQTRLVAFGILERLVQVGDAGIREAVLKATYQGIVKGSRNTTVHTLGVINMMKNSAAKLWGYDSNLGYTTGFTFIRGLAIHLRSSITGASTSGKKAAAAGVTTPALPQKEAYKAVYNWQYVHSLDFWSRVLSMHCSSLAEATSGKGQSPLRPLIYPLVQVTLGAMRLIPTATYFPLRFHLIRSLLRLSAETNTYIPLASALYEVLATAEMRKPPKNSNLKPLDFSVSIRAPKSYLRTRIYQDGVGEQVVELLSEFFALWSKNIAFPELSLPLVVMLKRWGKEVSNAATGNKNVKVNKQVALLVQKMDTNARFVEEKRRNVDFSPRDRAGVEGFLKEVEWKKTPIGAFVDGQRQQREEKEKVLRAAREEEEKRRKEEEQEEKGERDAGWDDEAVDIDVDDDDEDEDAADGIEDLEGSDDELDGVDGLEEDEDDEDED